MFPLLKLPHTALLNLLSTMHPAEVMFLTVFFPRFRHIARSVKWPQNELIIMVRDDGIRFGVTDRNPLNLHVKLKPVDILENPISLRIGKNVIDCEVHVKLQEAGRLLEIQCAAENSNNAYDMLVEHALDIFRLSPLIHCSCRQDNLRYVPSSKPIGKLVMLPEDQKYPDAPVPAEELYEFMTKHPFLEALTVARTSEITSNSKFLTVNNLYWFYGELMRREVLHWFSGQHLGLVRSKLSTSDVIALVRHWMDGGYQSLQTMFFFKNHFRFELDEIKIELNLNQDRPKKSPARYTTPPSNLDYFESNLDLLDCSKALDIVRGSDGSLASIRVLDNCFLFYVWKDRLPAK